MMNKLKPTIVLTAICVIVALLLAGINMITAPKIAEALQNHPDYNGSPEMIFVEDMEEAVSTAYAYAEEGDIVALSPASASFDRYKNFEIRGKHFKELVSKIGQVDGISAEELWPEYK